MMQDATEPARHAHPPHATRADGCTTTGMWFGQQARPLAGWWTSPERPSRDGVVIAAPLGYEYWSTHRSLRSLAEALARDGRNVLRFDWDGTGDSAGDAGDPGRVAAWRASLAEAVKTMRAAGVERIALVGLRFGATLALLDAAALGVDEVIACAPVASGRRWLRELRMLGIADPEQPDTVIYSGLVIDGETAAGLAEIDPASTAPRRVARTLLVTRSDPAGARLIQSLRADGRSVDEHACEAMQTMLDVPAGEDSVPAGWIEPILAWLGPPQACATRARPEVCQATEIAWQGSKVLAHFTLIDDLAAVCSQPLDRTPDTVVVFLNSGADPHVGPGRAWVEYSRSLASLGYACMRADFTAFGESPDGGRPPGRPYDPHCIDDTARMVMALRGRYRRIVLAGLCVGAWLSLLVAQTTCVEGVFALNPPLSLPPGWKGPVFIRLSDAVAWRAPVRRRQRLLARLGVWSILDAVGIRRMASRWLIALRRRRIPVFLSYAEGDDGLAYLRDCCSRRLARESRHGYLTLEEVPGIDHPLFHTWRRSAIVEQMTRFLASLPPAQPS